MGEKRPRHYGGYVRLLDKKMEVVRSEYYQTRTDRLETVTRWKKLYGRQFLQMAIQIAPEGQIKGDHQFAKVYDKIRDDANKDLGVYVRNGNS
jgi:hypothetical protein